MGQKVILTLNQGNVLLRTAYGAQFPDKLGDKSFTAGMRATFSNEIRALYKALRKVSPILTGRDKKIYFGPDEHYKRLQKDLKNLPDEVAAQISVEDLKVTYECLEPGAEQEVELSGSARNGLYRILLLWTHPESKYKLSPGAQEETVWPMAEQIRCVASLEKETGAADKATVEIDWDEDKVEEPATAQA